MTQAFDVITSFSLHRCSVRDPHFEQTCHDAQQLADRWRQALAPGFMDEEQEDDDEE